MRAPSHDDIGFRLEIELFNDSLARCLRSGQFFERFYDLFLASSPEVRDRFRSTDFRKQRRMLQSSFYMLVEYITLRWPECEAYLERIAVNHGKRNRDIPGHLYDLWLECLLRTAKEYDPLWSPEVEEAWRYTMGAGISFLKSRYDGPAESPQARG